MVVAECKIYQLRKEWGAFHHASHVVLCRTSFVEVTVL